MNKKTKEILQKHGWTVECESPLEVSNADGAFARYLPAELLIDYILELDKEEVPLSPDDLKDACLLPDFVIKAVNNIIKEKFRGKSFTFKLKELIKEIKVVHGSITERELNDNHYLDIEGEFRKNGWKVEYEQPSYGDSDFDSYFTFTPKQK